MIAVKLANPEFEGQTKSKLGSSEARALALRARACLASSPVSPAPALPFSLLPAACLRGG